MSRAREITKKALVALGAVASVPLVLYASFHAADLVYIRFFYEGEIKDFAPGDALGVFTLWGLFSLIGWVLSALVWSRLYRRVSTNLEANAAPALTSLPPAE